MYQWSIQNILYKLFIIMWIDVYVIMSEWVLSIYYITETKFMENINNT